MEGVCWLPVPRGALAPPLTRRAPARHVRQRRQTRLRRQRHHCILVQFLCRVATRFHSEIYSRRSRRSFGGVASHSVAPRRAASHSAALDIMGRRAAMRQMASIILQRRRRGERGCSSFHFVPPCARAGAAAGACAQERIKIDISKGLIIRQNDAGVEASKRL